MQRRPSHAMLTNTILPSFRHRQHFTTKIYVLSAKSHFCCYHTLKGGAFSLSWPLTSRNMTVDVTLRSTGPFKWVSKLKFEELKSNYFTTRLFVTSEKYMYLYWKSEMHSHHFKNIPNIKIIATLAQ